MSIAATYISATQFSAVYDARGNKDLTGQCAIGTRIRVYCGTDGYKYGVVTDVSYSDPTTTVTISGDSLTTNLVSFDHGNDVPSTLANHGHTGPADGGSLDLSEIGAATAQALADEAAARVSGDEAAATARSLLTPMTRMLNATFPLRIDSADGASLSEDRAFTLVLASLAEILATGSTLSGKVVTDTVLAAATKLLISTSATIYVATTGSDSTGTGASGAPFASIAKAVSSLAGKLIASGVLVTIQVAHGTYAISSTITINHPDADKIQILGDATAETTVAVSAVNASAKTITVAGDYTSSILAGDMVIITGSSTSGLNGAYKTSGVAYSGGNTVLTCSVETFASSTVGGGSLIIKPCNRVILNCASGVTCFTMSKIIYLIAGFRFIGQGSGRAAYCAYSKTTFDKCIVESFDIGFEFDIISVFNCGSVAVKSCVSYGLLCWYASVAKFYNKIFFDSCGCGVNVVSGASVYLDSGKGVFRNNTTDCYPAANTVGNLGACVYIS